MTNRREKVETMTDFILLAQKSLQTISVAMKLEDAAPWKESYEKPKHCIKKQRQHFVDKSPCSQRYGFSSFHVWMWELVYKKAEHWRIDVFQLWC